MSEIGGQNNMGGGDQQTDPVLQQYQQQQQYKQLGQTLTQNLQGIGRSVGQPMPYSQVAQPPSVGAYGQPQTQTGTDYAASGPLFAQQGMGAGGINQQQLAQILQLLGYG
jgi:hypothetical protein